jgi:tetratricopeptide (TPR) repeat protein
MQYDARSIDLKRAKAVTLRAQSQALWNEGEFGQAFDKANESSQILGGLGAVGSPDPNLSFELSHSLDREGEALAAQGKHGDALPKFEKALEIRQRLSRLPTKDTAVADQRQRDLAVALERAGNQHDALKEFDKALDLYETSFKIRNSRFMARRDDPDAAEDMAVGLDLIANIQQEQNSDDPLPQLTRSIEIREKLVLQNPLNTNWQNSLAIDYVTVGYVWLNGGNQQNALEPLKKALKIRQLLVDRNPDVPKWQEGLAETLY